MTGSIVRAFVIFLPAFIAEFVRFEIAVIPATCIAENLAVIVSADFPNGFKSTFLAAFSRSSKPFVASFNLSFCLSLSSVSIDSLVADSNCLLSNRISTTLSSTCLLIIWSPPSTHFLQSYQK